jgi:hypothetical protein
VRLELGKAVSGASPDRPCLRAAVPRRGDEHAPINRSRHHDHDGRAQERSARLATQRRPSRDLATHLYDAFALSLHELCQPGNTSTLAADADSSEARSGMSMD